MADKEKDIKAKENIVNEANSSDAKALSKAKAKEDKAKAKEEKARIKAEKKAEKEAAKAAKAAKKLESKKQKPKANLKNESNATLATETDLTNESKQNVKKASKKPGKKTSKKKEKGLKNVAGIVNKIGIRLTGKILGIVTLIMVVLVGAVLINVLLNMTALSDILVENQLQASAYAVKSHYDSVSEFEYKVGTDGNLYKGTTNLIYEKGYIDEFRDGMNTYTAIFFEDELRLTSFEETEGLKMAEDAKEQCISNGYYFTDDLIVNGVEYYAYYKTYSISEEGEVNGIMIIAVEKEETGAITKSAILLIGITAFLIMVAAVVLVILFVRAITKSIKRAVKDMDNVSHGNLNFSVNDKLLDKTDEIGDMARGIQQIINNFKTVVSKIFEASNELTQFTEAYGASFGKISETMGSVNIAVEEIANGATSQANETMVANNEMNNMGNAIVDASGNVDNLGVSSKKMTGYSDQARSTLEELSIITEKTMKSVDTVQNQTNLTNKSALEIQEATDLIANIASQTNLLSLNASIEAARAGENGRGFAVVANEIRNLADQSRHSAEKIASIVNSLISNSNESVETMNDVMKIMQIQNEKLDDTKNMFASLNSEIESVNEAIEGIKGEMSNINSLKSSVMASVENLAAIAEENAASTEETSAAMVELSEIIDVCNEETRKLVDLAEGLDSSIRSFKL